MTEYFSVKAGINQFLKDLAFTSYIYHRELPQNPSYPATVYDIVSRPPVEITQDVGVVGFRQARIQIDVYSQSLEEAEEIMEKYFEKLASFSGSLGVPGYTDVDIWDEGGEYEPTFEQESTLRELEVRTHDFMMQW